MSNEIQQKLNNLEGWKQEGDAIVRHFEFGDFTEAMRFVNKVAEAAEEAQHHPDIAISWNKVTLTLTTHSEGEITEKDLAMAERINTLIRRLANSQ